MIELKTSKIGSFVASDLSNATGPAHVLAVFPRHIYLVMNRQDKDITMILSPLTEQESPLSIILEEWPDWSSLRAQQGYYRNNTLKLGRYNINISDADICPSSISAFSGNISYIKKNIKELTKHLKHRSIFLRDVLDPSPSSTLSVCDVHWLIEGIRLRDSGLLHRGAMELAGLGVGLTPAGDDFLCGIMLAAWFFAPKPRDLCLPLLRGAHGATTTLSFAFLNAAAAGHASFTWRYFLEKLKKPVENDALQQCLMSIIAHGATSGADTLAGFIWAIEHMKLSNNS
ncbi:DUF2877 domain-containing protein [Acetobacter sp. UBA5411]|mgnify:CR=1 FL=1|uniref:DUF2877 domain-containing protein n=1 Tax=Acetobacter sp. UBA5411 TaxID=1945905 RepID=UPI0025BA4BBB|nr:DUF2877 domain-containing protein [Acetobacter sp. UBA5411]